MTRSLREAALLVGLPEARVRALLRAGLVEPPRDARGRPRFGFEDLVALRAARNLLEAGVSPRRIREAVARVRQLLPDRAVSALRLEVDGDEVVVRDGGTAWTAASGQLHLSLEVEDLAAEVAPLPRRPRLAEPAPVDARSHFARGAALEVEAPSEAAEAYRHALALAPRHPGAHLALGRLLDEAGRIEDAAAHLGEAAALAPTDARAHLAHAEVLARLGRAGEARAAFARAAALDPARREAHRGLARAARALGDEATAAAAEARFEALDRDR